MAIHDISMTISETMPVYKNNPEKIPARGVVRSHEQGCYESELRINLHTGTHLDAPLHVLVGGADILSYDLDRCISDCQVVALGDEVTAITEEVLKGHSIASGAFVLFKTRNSHEYSFNPNFVWLSADGARYLAAIGVIGVGLDALGVERNQPSHDTHRILFDAGISILEGIRLGKVTAGRYWLLLTPLKIAGAEASPVRALLLDREELARLVESVD